MDQYIINEANRLKQQAGQNLENQLRFRFQELLNENIIKSFVVNQNFQHIGYIYKKQYLANFLLTTLDDKYIVINSSTSYRQDRVKTQSYDLDGIKNNSSFSKDIVASILLYPDDELINNSSFKSFRDKFNCGILYSPASHVLVLSELLEFIQNHTAEVELLKEAELEESDTVKPFIKDGSFYGLKGNAFEKEVVEELNNTLLMEKMIQVGSSGSQLFDKIILTICGDNNIIPEDILRIKSTNTIKKLRNGGNPKTDISISLETRSTVINETASIKTTTQNQVSCHDYKAADFIRVLDIENTKLANYFLLFQRYGGYEKFALNITDDYSPAEFEELLDEHKNKLVEWALKGDHDVHNLIDIDNQISNYLLINKNKNYRFIKYDSYIKELFDSQKLNYGIPLSWTYPSKQLGKRIQFKMPIIQ